MAPWTATIREKGKGQPARQTEGQFPSVQGKQLISPYYLRGPVFQKTSNGFFLESSIPYTSEALKKENVKENLGGRGCRSGSFRHSIVYPQ
jgi:hypothetical protein